MKRAISTITILAIVFLSIPLEAQWAKIYGGTQGASGHVPDCIQQCRDGGYVIVGSFWAGIYQAYDAYILKLNSHGEIEWQYAYGHSFQDNFSYVQQTTDDGYIVSGGATIIKLNRKGKVEWARYLGILPTFIQETPDGGYIASGYGDIMKLSPKGRVVWDFKYRNVHYEDPFQPTADGGYIFAAADLFIPRVTKLTPTGYIEWQKTYGGSGSDNIKLARARQIVQTLEGDYVLAGTAFRRDGPNTSIWVLKLDPKGNIKWQKVYDSYGNDRALSILEANDGGYLIACDLNMKFSIMKLSKEGNVHWIRTYDIGHGNNRDYSKHPFQATSDGGYVSACTYSHDSEYFTLLKLLSDCNISQNCDFMGSTDVSVSKINVEPIEGFETPEARDIKSERVNISFRSLDFSVGTLCRAESTYTLRIRSQNGGQTYPYPGKYIYYGGKEIQIKAKPGAHNKFFKWSGDVPVEQEMMKSLSLTMDSNKKVLAEFLIPIPKRPIGLKAEALSWNRVKLTWTDKSKNELGFKIERKQEGETQWVEIVTLKANRKSYTNQGLAEGTSYQYRVRSYNQTGYSKYSNKAVVKTKAK